MINIVNLMLIIGMTLFVCSSAPGLVMFFGFYKFLMTVGE